MQSADWPCGERSHARARAAVRDWEAASFALDDAARAAWTQAAALAFERGGDEANVRARLRRADEEARARRYVGLRG